MKKSTLDHRHRFEAYAKNVRENVTKVLLKNCYVSTVMFFIVGNCLFLVGIIFFSSIVLVWTFNTRGVYNLIMKKANIPVDLILLFNGALFPFCYFLESGVTNELKSLFLLNNKKVRVVYSTKDKTLLLVKR